MKINIFQKDIISINYFDNYSKALDNRIEMLKNEPDELIEKLHFSNQNLIDYLKSLKNNEDVVTKYSGV